MTKKRGAAGNHSSILDTTSSSDGLADVGASAFRALRDRLNR